MASPFDDHHRICFSRGPTRVVIAIRHINMIVILYIYIYMCVCMCVCISG